jgi:hypothetical protein
MATSRRNLAEWAELTGDQLPESLDDEEESDAERY